MYRFPSCRSVARVGMMLSAWSLPVIGGCNEAIIPVSIDIAAQASSPGREPSQRSIIDISAEADGTSWGVINSAESKAVTLRDGRWQEASIDALPLGFTPLMLRPLADGSVAGLWYDYRNPEEHCLTRHHNGRGRIWAKFRARLRQPFMLALADGGVLITEAGRKVIRLAKDHPAPVIHELPKDAFIEPKRNDDGTLSDSFSPICSVQDARGTVWLWSPSMRETPWLWRLSGYGTLDDDDTLHLRTIPPMKKNLAMPVSLIAPWKDGRVVIALAGAGLFDYDAETDRLIAFQATDNALNYVERVFFAAGAWHIIATPQPTDTEVSVSKTFSSQIELKTTRHYDPARRTTVIFRLEDKAINPLTWKLDVEPVFGWVDRPFVETTSGLWICSAGGGLMFFPSGKKQTAVRHDWRTGLPLKNPKALVKGTGDQIIALDPATRQSCIVPPIAVPKTTNAPRVSLANTQSLLVEDAAGGIWGRLDDGEFHVWKNERWAKVEVPADVKRMSGNVFLPDSAGQAWLIPLEGNGASAVCELRSGIWQVFTTLTAALEQSMKPGARLHLRDFPSLVPVASAAAPRQIGFLQKDGSINVFFGRWREWNLHDFAGEDARVTGVPEFDAKGRFTLPIQDQWWMLGDNGVWTKAARSADQYGRTYRSENNEAPRGWTRGAVRSVATDRHGVAWVMDDRNKLWKAVPGCSVPVLQTGELNPIAGGGAIYEVMSDLHGNAFVRLEFGWSGGSHLAVRARLPLARSEATVARIAGDSVLVTLGAKDRGSAWHRWRLDGGEWSDASASREVKLSGVTPGEHKLEVLAYNADLTPAPASNVLKVTVTALADDEIVEAVRSFEGNDLDASERAARRLRSQGTKILPFLRKQLETANDRTRWWIEAVIQQIGDTSTN